MEKTSLTEGFGEKSQKPKYKITPLKKLYYNKFSYKIVLLCPIKESYFNINNYNKLISIWSKPKNASKNKNKMKVAEEKQKVEEYTKYLVFKKIIDNHIKKFYKLEPKILSDTMFVYSTYGPIKSVRYGKKHSLYIKTENEFNELVKKLKKYIIEIEKPLNQKHIELYGEDIFLERNVRQRLFFNLYRYKCVAYVPYGEKTDLLLAELRGIFSGRANDDVCVKNNFCSVTVAFNNKSDLLLFKLISHTNVKYYEAILISELEGQDK